MAVRTEHRVYTHSRGARFRSGEKELVLHATDSFKLFLDKKAPYIVKDGVVYRVKSSLVRELKARSEVVKPTKDYARRELVLDTVGIDVAAALEKHLAKSVLPALEKLSAGQVRHGVLNGRAYLEAPIRVHQGQAVVSFFLTPTVLGFGVYAPPTWNVGSWNVLPALQQQARKLAKYLNTREGIVASKFKLVKSKVANVRTPSGSPFSGTIYSYLSNWTRS